MLRKADQNRRRLVIAASLFGAAPLICASELPDAVKLQAQTGTTKGLFPLKVEARKRYLIDERGRPFLIHGDSAWSLIVQLSREELELYLDARRKQGFNALLINLIEHKFAENPPKNRYGEGPFLTPSDFGTPNEHYFAHADYVIARAGAKGMLVLLAPAYLGYEGGSEGWYQEMKANGVSRLRAYGRYLANRLRHHANILWVHGGDFEPPEKELLRAVATGISEVDSRWLHTYHGSRGASATGFLGTAEKWLQVSNIYTDATNVVSLALREYNLSQRPFFLIEAVYEGEGADELTVRRQAFHAVLSGACGHVMGNLPTWKFGEGWQEALGSKGATALSHLRKLLELCAWWTLVPDTGNRFLVDGTQNDGHRAVAALANDRSFGLAYMPSSRQVTVNLGLLAGPKVRIQWFDPATGWFMAVRGAPFIASGLRVFEPAASKADVLRDRVLVLESIS
jgi:hypothetical protein